MTKRILTLLSNFGYWGIELFGPMIKLEETGYTLNFCTPKGGRPVALPPSYDPEYYDPPLGCNVTTPEDAEIVKSMMDSPKLDHPINLSEWMPERPYFCHENFLRTLETYYEKVRQRSEEMTERYDGLLVVGGSGPIIDMVNNQRIHDVILAFYRKTKPIASICYGVACLAFARDFNERMSIIRGKHVTGHCIEYDYHDGTGFIGTDLNIGPPPYVLEYILTDAVGTKGKYHGNFGKETSVIVDYPFITARSLQCSHEFGEKFVEMLDSGLKRYGW